MKQSKVIAYVGANSDHPHAAMIVEWLLTGKKVEMLLSTGEWVGFAGSWSEAIKYRFKPEPKRAYRVYIDNNGNAQTFNIDTEPTPCGVEWLTDWIEYDTAPKKWETCDHIADTQTWPSDLVARIAKIDIKAAEWLRDNWESIGKMTSNLMYLMSWSNTPQGYRYWENIYRQLGE